MKKQHLLSLAMAGLFAAAPLAAQTSGGSTPQGKCNASKTAPNHSCNGKTGTGARGVDSSIRSSYSISSESKKASAGVPQNTCGANSCNGGTNDGTTPPKPKPQPGTNGMKAKRSTLKK